MATFRIKKELGMLPLEITGYQAYPREVDPERPLIAPLPTEILVYQRKKALFLGAILFTSITCASVAMAVGCLTFVDGGPYQKSRNKNFPTALVITLITLSGALAVASLSLSLSLSC